MRSVKKALTFIGADVRVVRTPDELAETNAAVLPGVGAFDDCLNALARQELLQGTRDYILSGRPFLGICVGYQALFEKSDEFNSCAPGLNVFSGKVVRFDSAHGLKIPQIGWNQVSIKNAACPLFKHIPSDSYFYFVHSFFPRVLDRSIIAAETEYGEAFASAIWKGNLFATQFHPEKSQKVGLQLLQNFVDLAAATN